MDWWTISAVVVSWIFCAGLNYGIIKAKLASIEHRVTRLEDERYVTRAEYESRHAEIVSRINSMRAS